MLIGYDASRAFLKEATGTENYSLELLKALAKVDRKNRYRVYLRDFSTPSLRDHPSISLRINSVAKQSGQKIATLLSVARNDKLRQGWPSNFEFRPIRPRRLWTQVGLAIETWKNPVDILFVPAHTLPLFRNRRVKTVVTIHDLGVEFLPGYHQFPQKYYLDLASKYASWAADVLIAVSKATKRDLVKRYGIEAKKIQVVAEGVDTHFFRPSPEKEIQNVKIKYQIEGNYILAVGTVQPRKNLETLIEAFAKMIAGPAGRFPRPTSSLRTYVDIKSKTSSDAAGARRGSPTPVTHNSQLVVAGKLGWDYQNILDLPKKLRMGKNVKFLGYVDRGDLPALYSGAVVFMAPSFFEGFGLPILEALACGCGVVASDIPAHREIYSKVTANRFQLAGNSLRPETRDLKPETIAEAMILVKPDDTRQWASVLYQYISQYVKRSSFTNRNSSLRRILALNYSWDKVARQTLAVFGNVMR